MEHQHSLEHIKSIITNLNISELKELQRYIASSLDSDTAISLSEEEHDFLRKLFRS
ncbi:hypothetical protein [Vibrio rhodolitus]|uniref:hypothetical protein n=1 Tax=Vibrio rhodolitus TaxID=2231649 RepID=UPI0013E057B2|nr:hypothetical protein [Vibrio rhodolitus]